MAGKKYDNACIDAALEVMTHFTKEDIEDYLDDVFSTARGYTDVTGQAAIQKAVKEVNKQTLEDLFQRNMITARNAKKLTFMKKMIESGKATLTDRILIICPEESSPTAVLRNNQINWSPIGG